MSETTETLAVLCGRIDLLAQQRNWPAVHEAATQAAAAYPAAWEPHYYIGRALLEAASYADASRHLTACMERFPAQPQFAVLYGYVGGRSLDVAEAARRWEALHARMPDAPGLRIGLAHAWRTLGRLDDAEQVLAQGVAQLPEHVPLLAQYADIASARQDWATAADRWLAAQARAPQRIDLLVATIGALRQAGRLDQAEAISAKAVNDHPEDLDLASARAAVATARQDWATVAACLQRVFAANAANLQAAIGLVCALVCLGRGSEAETVAEAALVHHPDNEMLLTEYAAMATRGKRWFNAMERWQAVYERCPPRISTYKAYIEALRAQDRYDLAEEIASEAIGFAPEERELLIMHAELAGLRLDGPEMQARWTALRRKFPDDQGIADAMVAARQRLNKEKAQFAKDDSAMAQAPVRGSIRLPDPPKTPFRLAPSGPSALDQLLAGTLPPPPAPPPRPGLLGRMRRLIGKF